MIDVEKLCIGIAELVPLFVTLLSFVYGLKHFFRRGKPWFLQTITLAMGSHALGSLYHLCYYYMVPLAVSSVIFGVLSICTMVAAKRGAEQWTI